MSGCAAEGRAAGGEPPSSQVPSLRRTTAPLRSPRSSSTSRTLIGGSADRWTWASFELLGTRGCDLESQPVLPGTQASRIMPFKLRSM
jgi:hypothetical protein